MRKQLSREELVKRLRKIEMSKQDFLKGAKKSPLFKKIKRRKKEDQESVLFDDVRNKRSEDWRILANQPVINPVY